MNLRKQVEIKSLMKQMQELQIKLLEVLKDPDEVAKTELEFVSCCMCNKKIALPLAIVTDKRAIFCGDCFSNIKESKRKKYFSKRG
jgi:hypothetical protein